MHIFGSEHPSVSLLPETHPLDPSQEQRRDSAVETASAAVSSQSVRDEATATDLGPVPGQELLRTHGQRLETITEKKSSSVVAPAATAAAATTAAAAASPTPAQLSLISSLESCARNQRRTKKLCSHLIPRFPFKTNRNKQYCQEPEGRWRATTAAARCRIRTDLHLTDTEAQTRHAHSRSDCCSGLGSPTTSSCQLPPATPGARNDSSPPHLRARPDLTGREGPMSDDRSLWRNLGSSRGIGQPLPACSYESHRGSWSGGSLACPDQALWSTSSTSSSSPPPSLLSSVSSLLLADSHLSHAAVGVSLPPLTAPSPLRIAKVRPKLSLDSNRGQGRLETCPAKAEAPETQFDRAGACR